MKSNWLPLAAVAGTTITLSLTAITLAAPANGAESPATAQVRQMEQQSRLREWSRGLGIDLPDLAAPVAQNESRPNASARSKPHAKVTASDKRAEDHDTHRDYAGDAEHEDHDEDESRS